MAQNPKRLRIVGAHDVGPVTRSIEIECVEGGAFAAIGGKYVILHTGLTIDDKAIKRAYTLRPVAGAPHHARMTIERLAGGPGSNALHAAKVGAELTFSGPWGKLVPETGLADRTLLVATDTGITSALGIVEQARDAGTRAPTEVLWLCAPGQRFLDVELVRAEIEASGVRFVAATIPAIEAPDRVAAAWAHVDARVAEASAQLVIATGDGAIVHPLRERLPASHGVGEVRIECYFHNPEKKSG
ncbi:MAG: FAD-dependent oxidoreductase [Polyangiales bacterium]